MRRTQNISYLQNINLLNEARENLERMIEHICYEYRLEKLWVYRDNARKDYLSLAKYKKCTKKRSRKAIIWFTLIPDYEKVKKIAKDYLKEGIVYDEYTKYQVGDIRFIAEKIGSLLWEEQ